MANGCCCSLQPFWTFVGSKLRELLTCLTHTPSLQKNIMSSLGYHLGFGHHWSEMIKVSQFVSVVTGTGAQKCVGWGVDSILSRTLAVTRCACELSSWAQATRATRFLRTIDFLWCNEIEYNAVMPLSSSKDEDRGGWKRFWIRLGGIWNSSKRLGLRNRHAKL